MIFSGKLILSLYGIFLICMGIIGFVSNPEKAQTAVVSGGTFGLLSIILGFLWGRGIKASRLVSFLVLGLLFLVFAWRMSVSWIAVVDGNSEKIFAASLISAMWLGTLCSFFLLRRASPPNQK